MTTQSEHACDTGYFDRTVCACGAMHSYCDTCGSLQDTCPYDDTTHHPAPMPPERGTAMENESERGGCMCEACRNGDDQWCCESCHNLAKQMSPAELGAGDVEALAEWLRSQVMGTDFCRRIPWGPLADQDYWRGRVAGIPLAAHDAKVARDTAEQIAQAIEAKRAEHWQEHLAAHPYADPTSCPGDYAAHDAYYSAARIARETR